VNEPTRICLTAAAKSRDVGVHGRGDMVTVGSNQGSWHIAVNVYV